MCEGVIIRKIIHSACSPFSVISHSFKLRYLMRAAINHITIFPSPFVTLVKLSKWILTTDLPLRRFCLEDDENAEKAM